MISCGPGSSLGHSLTSYCLHQEDQLLRLFAEALHGASRIGGSRRLAPHKVRQLLGLRCAPCIGHPCTPIAPIESSWEIYPVIHVGSSQTSKVSPNPKPWWLSSHPLTPRVHTWLCHICMVVPPPWSSRSLGNQTEPERESPCGTAPTHTNRAKLEATCVIATSTPSNIYA